jgi:sterol O-acyltransferase
MSLNNPLGTPAVLRTPSGGFKTSEGTIYLSKPFLSKKSKKHRALIKFAPRTTHFDTTNELSGANEFRVSHPLVGVATYR